MGSLETLKLLKGLDERLNTFQDARCRAYLADLTQTELSTAEARRALEITLYASNLEHAGDIIHLNLADRIKAKAKESIAFTVEEQASLDDLCLIIHDNLRTGDRRSDLGDLEGAKRLIAPEGCLPHAGEQGAGRAFPAARRRHAARRCGAARFMST